MIGGGAAGFFAALRAKAVNPSLAVSIIESAPKPLGKVRISGGGRCNVTHHCFDTGRLVQYYPRGQKELKGIFSRFGAQETVQWFKQNGVQLKTEPDGRMFPVTDDSQTIIDCLMSRARSLGITLLTKTPVLDIRPENGRFTLQTPQGNFQARAVLLATGSAAKGYAWARQLGHTVEDPVPSLFTFKIRHPLLADLQGISFPKVKARLDIPGAKPIQQEGPLLITHWGLSGPAVLRLSAWGARELYGAQYRGKLTVDFLPEVTDEALKNALLQQKAETPRKQIVNACPVDLTRHFWENLLKWHQVPLEQAWADIPVKAVNRLVEVLKRCPFEIEGKGVFKDEFVTAGGILLKEIDLRSMESRIQPHLYFAGEIIDVDGLTGGFNFQNAWSTGWIAGESTGIRAKVAR